MRFGNGGGAQWIGRRRRNCEIDPDQSSPFQPHGYCAQTIALNECSEILVSLGSVTDENTRSPSYRPRIESGVTDPVSSRRSPPQADTI